MNPKGRYDLDRSLEVNTGLAAPLLSRFDLVLLVSDGMHAARCVSCASWLAHYV